MNATIINTEALINSFDNLLINKVAQPVVKNVKFQTLAQLKKASSERLANLYFRIFGEMVFNPYQEREEIMWAVNNWMEKQVIKAINALAGVSEEQALGLAYFSMYDQMVDMVAGMKQMEAIEAKRPIEDNMIQTVLDLLAQGFTCSAIGNMGLGVSAKQASRIKRGRRYSNVTGIEEKKPVARKSSAELELEAFGI